MPPPDPQPAALPPSRRTGIALGLAVWALVVAAGFRVVVEYELRAGVSAAAPDSWPADTGLRFDATRVNLIMFAHPQCPCSTASMAELATIVTRCRNELCATVCFLDLDGEPEEWTHSSLWREAAAIPGVQVIADHDGKLAARFGSATSGQTFLFDRDGRKVFSGGITGARGHEGDNHGRQFVIALAHGEVCAGATTPVFGCSLHDAPTRAEGRAQ